MVIFGVALLVAAVVGFFFMRRARDQLHAMIGSETLPVNELELQRRASDEVGARGGFRKQCELVGQAHPRPEGTLVSELSKTECVWFRYVVKRQYERVTHRDGRRRVSRHTETVAQHTSWEGYALRDDHGVLIGVDPNGTDPDRPEQVVSRFEPYHPQGPTVFGIQLPNIFDGSGTIGYEYQEWVIRPGRRLYVLGEVHDKIGPLVIGKPERDGHFIISTRTEQELRDSRRTQHQWLAFGVPAAALVGLVLVILGILR
ncbi:E3 ubiquitin ligase family protein [Saccharopolyspora sp. K220]|uniref:E3 ubiquitin ligase family protein n=1 Tax=Saccharopolyspora soli TaxID=2926618 RepID=UPI001F570609|nr:E3 ubiquitin ligase family protein [Saccharopolyspora soli]MCI2421168.1 E3 ubiquitin ligase family protein [Saccharopolyspora soli]